MIRVRSLWLAALVACGGPSHPAPSFDAKQLAAELDHAMAEMAAIASDPGADCAAIVKRLGDAEQRARGPVERARQAQANPERAKQLTAALRAYDKPAAGRSDVIVGKLVVCYREHVELQDQIQHVVDSIPTPTP
jgi:hypothetical protein